MGVEVIILAAISLAIKALGTAQDLQTIRNSGREPTPQEIAAATQRLNDAMAQAQALRGPRP